MNRMQLERAAGIKLNEFNAVLGKRNERDITIHSK